MTINESVIHQLKQLKGKPLKQKIEHIITYFWMPILLTLGLIIATASYIVHISNTKDVGLSVICLNAFPDRMRTEQFLEDFAKYASIDTDTYKLQIDDAMIISDEDASASYETSQVIMIRAASQSLDALIGDIGLMTSYIYNDFFADLHEQLTPQQREKYTAFFLYADMAIIRKIQESPESTPVLIDPTKPELMVEPVPVALQIPKESKLAKQYYPGRTTPLCIGIIGNTVNLERTLAFLDYIME